MHTPIKYISKKSNGTLMWVPVYKKGEGPSSLPPKPLKKVELKKSTVPISSTKNMSPAPRQVAQNTEKTTLCKGCGKKFQWKQQGRHAQRKFCEARCRVNYWAKKQADQWRVDRTGKYKCKNCDKKFSQKNLRGPIQKYCSAECRVSYNNRVVSGTKSFVERVAEHLPPTLPIQETKETLAPARPVPQPPSWQTLVEEAGNMGITLDKEPTRSQNFYIALLMARRAHHHEEWKKLLKSQNVQIRQLPETYMALKSVSGEGAISAARALKTRMGM